MIKRIIKIVIASMLIIISYSSITPKQQADTYPDDFYTNEAYYYELCSSSSITNEQYETCLDFRAYVEEKNKGVEALINANTQKMKELQANITEAINQLNVLQKKLDDLNVSIKNIQTSINAIQEDIVVLEKEIKTHQDNINSLDTQIKDRMKYNQSHAISNNYIQFIMGASNFSDLLRRIVAVNQLTQHDINQINKLTLEKKALDESKVKKQQQQDNLVVQKKSLEETKATTEKAEKQFEELLFYYHQKEAELKDDTAQHQKDLENLLAASDKMDKAMSNVVASEKFGRFIKRSFRISYGFPQYENFGSLTGGFHPAIDCAINAGSPVYAVGNGIVVGTGDGCGWGYIGSTCNSGRGNYVIYITRIGNHVYGIHNYHLSQVNVKVGDVVRYEETLLGLSGSSGSSSGAHLHFEVIDVGVVTLQKAIDMFKSGKAEFGAPWGLDGICERRGTPCFANPLTIYGLKLHGIYDWSK